MNYSGVDTRNAIFVVNTFGVIFYVLMIVSISLFINDTQQYDDDQVQKVMDTLANTKTSLTIAFNVVGLLSTISGIYGAFTFKTTFTAVGGYWYLLEAGRSLFHLDIILFVTSLVFAYPHAVFYHEVKNGIMSKETYAKEKACLDCLCVCC